MKLTVAYSWVVALGLVGWARSVSACDCGGPEQLPALPSHSQPGGPNTRVWVPDNFRFGFEEPLLQVVSTDGALVEVEQQDLVTSGGRRLYRMLIPTAPLEPGQYEVRGIEARQLRGTDNQEWTGFSVQSAPHAGPQTPTVVGKEERGESSSVFGGSSCGDTLFFSLDVSHTEPLLVLDIDNDSRFPDPLEPWVVTALRVKSPEGDGSSVVVGQGPCEGSWDFEEGRAVVRLRTLNTAGDRSPWTDADVLDPGCQCAAVGGSSDGRFAGHWLLGLAGVVAVAWRRRVGSASGNRQAA